MTNADHDARLLRLIADLQKPCICTDRRGHADPGCPWYDAPDRTGGLGKEAHEAAMERLHG